MVRIDYFLFGYRRVSPIGIGAARCANILLRLGISASIDESGSFFIRERDFLRFSAYKSEIEYTATQLCGIPGYIRRNKHRYLSFFVLLCTVFLVYLLSGVVWDVRVSGNTLLSEEDVREYLASCDLRAGTRWRRLSISRVETELLSEYPEIAWVAVNRRGTVAYVEIVEREGKENGEAALGYRNIVAAADAVIEEITVKKGVAAVKVGDVVRRGDILISGVLPEELGGGFCYAEGEVRGTQRGEISVDVAKSEEIIHKDKGKAISLSVKIFGFFINIFKKYGNLTDTYDIIEDEEELLLFGKHRLPISVIRTYRQTQRRESVTYADWKMVEIAHARMKDRLSEYLVGAELLKIRTEGEYTEEGYRLNTSVIYLTDIGLAAPFEVVGEKE